MASYFVSEAREDVARTSVSQFGSHPEDGMHSWPKFKELPQRSSQHFVCRGRKDLLADFFNPTDYLPDETNRSPFRLRLPIVEDR